MKEKIKVLIVDDSSVVRGRLLRCFLQISN